MRASNQPFKKFSSQQSYNNSKEQSGETNKSLVKAMEIFQKVKKYAGNFSFDPQHYNATNLVHFGTSLSEIIAKIENSKPVFVHCIKPNENSFSNQVNADIMIKQVRGGNFKLENHMIDM